MTEKVVRFQNCVDDHQESKQSSASVVEANGKPTLNENQESIEKSQEKTENPEKWKAVTRRIRTALLVKNAVKPARSRRRSLWRTPTETVDPFIQKFSTRSENRKSTPTKRKASQKSTSTSSSSGQPSLLDTIIELESKELESDSTSVYDYETSWASLLKDIPSVFSPDGSFIYIWFYFMVFAIRYNLWVLILRIAFPVAQSKFTIVWLVFDYFCDFIYVIDVVISFRTGFLEEGILITDVKRVVKRYALSKQFLADIISVLPTDILCAVYQDAMPVLRLNRLIKSYKSFRIKSLMESHTSYPTFLRVFFLLHLMFLLINWNAGFYIMISRAEGFGTNVWVYPGNGSLYQQYLKSLYWSTLTLTAIGDLPSPATNVEYVYTIACYLCGVFMFATIVGNAGSIIVNRNASRLDFERQREGTNSYMRKNRVPKDLQRRVLMWYDYSWTRGRISSGGGDLNSLTLLPDKLKTEIALHVNLETLRKVTFLQKCQPEFLHDLVLRMKIRIFTPGDFICRKGEVAREMYVIIDGRIEVVGEAGQVLKALSGGDFFGEIGILSLSEGQNRRTADVRTVGYVECFVLSKEDVLNATCDYPEAQAVLAEYGRRRLQGQSTRKDPRLVDMEDSDLEKKYKIGIENNNARTEELQTQHQNETRELQIGSRLSIGLSSSSSSPSLLTPLPPESTAHLLVTSYVSPQHIDRPPSPGVIQPRRSSRAGLLDPLPIRRGSAVGLLSGAMSPALLNCGSEGLLASACIVNDGVTDDGVTNNGVTLSRCVGDICDGSDTASFDDDNIVMRMMTLSFREVLSKVKKVAEKRTENQIRELKGEIKTLRANLAEKNDRIIFLKSQISTQDVELGAWRQAIEELEHDRVERNDHMRQLDEELEVLRSELYGSTSKMKTRRQGTTISMTSLLNEDDTQC